NLKAGPSNPKYRPSSIRPQQEVDRLGLEHPISNSCQECIL
ncbi:19363_t:CDS:2, partial [Gigaspora rosea]